MRALMGNNLPPRFKFKDTYDSIEVPTTHQQHLPSQATLEAKFDELIAEEEVVAPTTQIKADMVVSSNLEVGTSNLFVDTQTGNIGIGTTAPAYKLDVHGSSNVGALTTTSISGDGSGLTSLNASNLASGTVPSARLSLAASDIPSLDAGKITSGTLTRPISTTTGTFSGDVGIGTTSPGRPLEIAADGGGAILNLKRTNAGTGQGALAFVNLNSNVCASVAATRTGAEGGNLVFYTIPDDTTLTSANPYLISERMRITSGGNVGIGTASPGYKLNVLTDTNYDGISLRDSTRELLKISKGNNGAYINMFESSVSKVNIATSGVSYLNGGNVGIGTTSPLSPLDIKAVKGITTAATANDLVSNATIRISGYAENHDVLCIGMLGTDTSGNSGNNPYAYIQNIWDTTKTARPLLLNPAGGNVGIGTTNPGYKLDVQGDINSTGKINMGNYAVAQGHMSSRTLTVGSTTSNYGGGNSWNTNTAAILLECTDNTEIAAHDSGTRVSSLMYYEGASTNRITIGRDMGWGTIASVRMCGSQSYPNRPVAVVGKSNGRVYDPNVIVYNSVLYNDGGLYNTSNGRFTAPAGYAGYYLITYTGLGGYQETGPNTRWRLNGNDLSWGAAHINASPCTSRWGLTCQFIYYLNAGDYLTHRVISGSIYGSSSIHSTTVVMFMGSR